MAEKTKKNQIDPVSLLKDLADFAQTHPGSDLRLSIEKRLKAMEEFVNSPAMADYPYKKLTLEHIKVAQESFDPVADNIPREEVRAMFSASKSDPRQEDMATKLSHLELGLAEGLEKFEVKTGFNEKNQPVTLGDNMANLVRAITNRQAGRSADFTSVFQDPDNEAKQVLANSIEASSIAELYALQHNIEIPNDIKATMQDGIKTASSDSVSTPASSANGKIKVPGELVPGQ